MTGREAAGCRPPHACEADETCDTHAGRVTTPLRVGLSIGGPVWRRPRWGRQEGRFLIGWLFVSLYIELPRRDDA